ncbi:SigE family RNA polymerase sigma factor [Streptomyces litchfieldiae]|uniref:SigE family RNA polymerase sigma factor n=1 Tax=Streptomyces litchfieldiae TaxID=3075543 RepID=A0ABU2MXX0_9ACTN|nr:SigE family RNA polymerase sigma factor [Streptomyces sp. DSM 44938]MDT0346212.1 SigE family RNA polymerase sigma factor [Streptomyces sp. DSM 44938]
MDFDDYVLTRGDALLRFAYVMCDDAQRAEDFVQEALVRCHRRWRRIERDAGLDAYVRKAIVRQYLSWRRRRAAEDRPTDALSDTRGRPDGAIEAIGERDAMLRLLAELPRRQRAVLVLRYYEDLPDGQIAELLSCSTATVRVHASRGLARLRRHPELAGLVAVAEEEA